LLLAARWQPAFTVLKQNTWKTINTAFNYGKRVAVTGKSWPGENKALNSFLF